MASLSENWDDFVNQALIVQELLLHPGETADSPHMISKVAEPEDSPQFITKMATPQGLIILSPDTHLDAVEKVETLALFPFEKLNEKCEFKQKVAEVRTPLKDCTNMRNREIMNDSMKITPEKSQSCKEFSSVFCPSSAEFAEFLTGIMEVSPVVKDGSFESLGGEAVTQCQPLVVTASAEDIPQVKVRARSGTYDLASPSCDLSHLCDTESKSSLQEVGLHAESGSDLLMSDINTDVAAKSASLPADSITNDNGKALPNEDNCEELRLDKCNDFEPTDSTHTMKDNTEDHKELLIVIGDDLNICALKPSKILLSKNSSLRRPHSGFSSAKIVGKFEKAQAPTLTIDDTDLVLSSQEGSNCDITVESVISETRNVENEKLLLEGDELQDMSGLTSVNVSEKSPDLELDEAKCVTLSVSTSEDTCTERQSIVDTAPKQVLVLKKGMSTSNLPSKAIAKGDTCTTDAPHKKAPLTKLPLMKPGQMQSKLTLRRPSAGLASSKSHTALLTAAQDGGAKGIDATMPSKSATKQQAGSSGIGHRETLGGSKLLPKLSLRPPSKTNEQSQGPRKIPQLHERLRIETKVLRQETVNVTQPQGLQPGNALKKPDASKLSTANLTRRPSLMKRIPTTSSMAKNTSALIKPPLPVMNASKTVAEEAIKQPVKTLVQIDGSRTVTKKVSPVKTLFPINGSRTVTKENQPVVSRTVTKEVQPAGSRTVTKTSGEQPLDVPGSCIGTPLTSDKFLAPRRLSNVFHTPSAVSGYKSDGDRKRNSFIPTPSRSHRTSSYSSQGSVSSSGSFRKPSFESPFPGTVSSGDETEAFKPNRKLVQNTPDVKLRRQSMWSPVKKNRLLGDDLAYQCTKKMKGDQNSLM